MARYIDAERLKRTFASGIRVYDGMCKLDDVIHNIENAPTANVVEIKQIEIIRDDLKWWLKTNTEKGVVYIPKHVVENMIAKMDGGKTE